MNEPSFSDPLSYSGPLSLRERDGVRARSAARLAPLTPALSQGERE